MNNIWEIIDKALPLDLTKNLIKIPSHKFEKGREAKVAEYLHSYFEEMGIESEIIEVSDGRKNIVAVLRNGIVNKRLLLSGHIDTVPIYDMKNALEPIEKEGNLYGRGTVDMKGPIASMIAAMLYIKKENLLKNGELVFAGVIDEEEKSLGTIHLLDHYNSDFQGAVVGEPTDLNICIAHRGLQWIEVEIIGKTVHGGNQDKGLNAISLASKFIQDIEIEMKKNIDRSHHETIGKGSFNIGTIAGGTQPSTVAGECKICFDRRWVPSENLELIMKQIDVFISDFSKKHPKYKINYKILDESVMSDGYSHESMDTDKNAEIVVAAMKAMGVKEAELTFFPAWSDGGLLGHYGKIPTIVFGPGKLESAHSNSEHIEIASIYEGVEAYVKTILNFFE